MGRTVRAWHRHGVSILCALPADDGERGALSGGQRQRVAIGRALVRDVDVFLFDEPLSNLDAKLRADLRVELKRLHNQLENTMIYVTHDQVEAMTLADRIAVMKGGLIMQLGSPDEIYNRPMNLYVADFIGSPSMNFREGVFENGVFKGGELTMPMVGYEFADPQTADRPAVIGIRPEHIITGELVTNAPVQMTVDVDLVEPMGSDTLVYAALDGEPFRIRMDGTSVLIRHARRCLTRKPRHVFDNRPCGCVAFVRPVGRIRLCH